MKTPNSPATKSDTFYALIDSHFLVIYEDLIELFYQVDYIMGINSKPAAVQLQIP